jgi:hypothetical protein
MERESRKTAIKPSNTTNFRPIKATMMGSGITVSVSRMDQELRRMTRKQFGPFNSFELSYYQINNLNYQRIKEPLGGSGITGRVYDMGQELRRITQKRSAHQGNDSGQSNYGSCLESGTGTPTNALEATNCYRCCADQGNALRQWNCGLCFENGIGIAKMSRMP